MKQTLQLVITGFFLVHTRKEKFCLVVTIKSIPSTCIGVIHVLFFISLWDFGLNFIFCNDGSS